MDRLDKILADQRKDDSFDTQFNKFLDLLWAPLEFLNFNSVASCALSLHSLDAIESDALRPFKDRIESMIVKFKEKVCKN